MGVLQKKLIPYKFYKLEELGTLNDAISSIKIKRGYYATLAQLPDGTGYSRIFIAHDEDLSVERLPSSLDNKVSFIRVIPWKWPNKKGYPHGIGAADQFNAGWNYGWTAGGNSTANVEYVPLSWSGGTKLNAKQNVTHVLGPNEPDRPDQANISVEKALELWPGLMKNRLENRITISFRWWVGMVV